jgi:hypothetical protein
MSPTPPVIPQASLISPSLWIFVGSVVNTVREWLKRFILVNYPHEILGLIRLLHLDTSLVAEAQVPPSGHPDLDAGYDDGLFFPLAVKGIDLLGELERGNFADLAFAPRDLLRLADASAGARNSPTLGHVAVLLHRQGLREFLSGCVKDLIAHTNQKRALGHGVELAGGSLFAFIVRSKAGGTGSGAAMEVALILREIDPDITVVGLELQPLAFVGASSERMRAIRYAADKELQAAQSGRFFKLIRRVDNDLQPNRNLPIEFAPSNGANDVRFFRREGHLFVGRPFDLVFIFEGNNAAASSHQRGHLPVRADGLKGLSGMVARFGCLFSCTPMGKVLREQLHNEMGDALTARDEYGWPRSFCSLGVAEVYSGYDLLYRYGPALIACRAIDLALNRGEGSVNQAVERLLSVLGLQDTGERLLDRLRTTEVEGKRTTLPDLVQARFRGLASLSSEQQLTNLEAIVNELGELIDTSLEEAGRSVLAELSEKLEKELRQMEKSLGLEPLAVVLDFAQTALKEHHNRLGQEQELWIVAENNMMTAMTENMGGVTQLQGLVQELERQQGFWYRLVRRYFSEELNLALLQLRNLLDKLQGQSQEKLQIRIEHRCRAKAIELLNHLLERLRNVRNQVEAVIAALREARAALEAQGRVILTHDFRFQVPVGICLLRDGNLREEDVRWCLDWLTKEGDAAKAAQAVVDQIYRQQGSLWQADETSLDWQELFRYLAAQQFRPPEEFQLLDALEARFSHHQVRDILRYCLSASAEYLIADEARTYGHIHLIRLLGAPASWHERLRAYLRELGQPLEGGGAWLFVDTGDPSRISFLQVRAGIAMNALKANASDRDHYQKHSRQHGEERLHTEPVWRLLPDLDPIVDPNDQRLRFFLLLGVLVGAMVEEGGSWWFQNFSGEREPMGQTPDEVLLFLLRNQDHCVEVVCRLQVDYESNGEELMNRLREIANRDGRTPFWDERTIKAVEDWLRWLDQQYHRSKTMAHRRAKVVI